MADFKIVEEKNRLLLKKQFKYNNGIPIVGWVHKKWVAYWINFLSGKTVLQVQECPEINKKHISLCKSGTVWMIGWVDKRYKDELLLMLEEKYPEAKIEKEVPVKKATKKLKANKLF